MFYACQMSAARRAGYFLPAVLVGLLSLFVSTAGAANTPGQRATDDLFLLVLIPAIGIGVLVQVLILYAVVKFRRRRGHTEPPAHPKTHDAKLEATWTIIPALILLLVGLATFQTLTITDEIPQDPDIVVRAVGHQWFWEFFVDDLRGNVTRTIGEVTVEAGLTVRLIIESVDVAHAVWVPGFGLKVDAIPGHVNVYWFRALKTGDFALYCAEFCGLNHYEMRAVLHVVSA